MAKATRASAPASEPAPTSNPATKTQTDPALLDLLVDEIKDLYWAENQLVKVLPVMQRAAASEALGNAISEHLEQTRMHVYRLDQVFELLGKTPQAKKCDAMEGLTKEGEAVLESTEEGTAARDAGIIIASQKVEHYEIAAYGSLLTLAKTLELNEVADLLQQTLAEEKEADALLTHIAESGINAQAAAEA